MGFLKNLLSGGEGVGAAINALLVEHYLSTADSNDRSRLEEQLVEVMRHGGFPNLQRAAAFDSFNSLPRFAQLNFLALALSELGVKPNLSGQSWMVIRNPFRLENGDESDIRMVSQNLERSHGVSITIGSTSIDISNW